MVRIEADSVSAASSDNVDKGSCLGRFWRREKLMVLIIAGVLCGFAIGIASNPSVQSLNIVDRTTVVTLIGFPGELFMRMLKLLILPLIMSSLIVGLADLDQSSSAKLGRRAIAYYMGTTVIAVVLGILLVVIINPGDASDIPNSSTEKNVRPLDSFLDLIRNMFPPNIVQACFMQSSTGVIKLKTNIRNVTVNMSDAAGVTALKAANNYFAVNNTHAYSEQFDQLVYTGSTTMKSGMNVLGLVVFSLCVGVVLGRIGEKARPFTMWVSILNDVVMELVSIVMWYSPVGIASLIAAKFCEMDDIQGNFERLAWYMVTVIVGLLIHSVVVLPGLYFLFVRKNPLIYIKGVAQALLTAFGTSSSSATLPVTFRCLEVNNKIDRHITRFVLPIGATINMDGTALYEAVAAIFIAQSLGTELTAGEYVAISVTATLASIGAAGIPQAGLVTMLIVLQTVGLPEDSVSLIIAVDWFLDRVRTTVNVLGDSIGAGIVAHLSRDDLAAMKHGDDGEIEESVTQEETEMNERMKGGEHLDSVRVVNKGQANEGNTAENATEL